jgi:hypothetical protein
LHEPFALWRLANEVPNVEGAVIIRLLLRCLVLRLRSRYGGLGAGLGLLPVDLDRLVYVLQAANLSPQKTCDGVLALLHELIGAAAGTREIYVALVLRPSEVVQFLD